SPSLQPHEPCAFVWASARLEYQPQWFPRPVKEFAARAAVSPDFAQLLAAAPQLFEQPARASAVLHAGGGDDDHPPQPPRIHSDRALAALDPPPPLEPAQTGDLGRLHARRVAATRGRRVRPPSWLPHVGTQPIVEARPDPGLAPRPEVAGDGVLGGKVVRPHPPWEAADPPVKDRVDDFT